MTNQERLVNLCASAFKSKGLDDKHLPRLKLELKEIKSKNEYDYFMSLYDQKARFSHNQHNLLVPYLLGIVSDIDLEREAAYTIGGLPDIDIDYIDEVRDYLKNDYAPDAFGRDKVCNIGSYSTYKMRSALLDVARVFGKEREEMLAISKTLPDKDEEGHKITWEKALEMDPILREFCEHNPEIYDVAKRLSESEYGPRIKAMGKHAAGLIISSQKIDNIVPLVLDRAGLITSAWPEGLNTQDLAPVGYVKFDLLSITNLKQIALICQLIKKRHNLESICALPGQKDWSDTSYLNDPKSLEMANRGDMVGTYQFDKWGIRKLAKDGGVTTFDDLVAYASLFRPGPLGTGLHEKYAKRKRGEEKYDLHPILDPILGKTYGVLCYQEQIMKIFEKVGGIPEKDTYDVVKAISKKNEKVFLKYKSEFIKEGGIRLRRDCKLEACTDVKGVVKRIFKVDKSLEENLASVADYTFYEDVENPYPKAMGYVAGLMKLYYPDKPFDRDFLHQEVAKAHARHLFDGIEPFAGYAFNLSHAVAYTYITARGLYLKAHYPLEFYAGTLMLETKHEKIKEYKTEALIHGIPINGIDINKSNVRFDIGDDGEIYFGLANIKGIGDEVAEKIVEGQPYSSFEQFLDVFGTAADVLKPLISLRAFIDKEPEILYKFYEDYKVARKNRTDSARRYRANIEKYDIELKELLSGYDTLCTWDETNLEIWENLFNKDEIQEVICTKPGPNYNQPMQVKFNRWKSLKKLYNKRKKSVDEFQRKEQDAVDRPFTLDKFNLDLCEVHIPEALQKLFNSKEEAQIKFLGFIWDHPLEKSPQYTGKTFAQFREQMDEYKVDNGPVEVMVIGYKKQDWKNGKGFSYKLQVEDANGEKAMVTVWPDDWDRFEEEFTTCRLLRLCVQPPTKFGFTLDSPPKWKRHTLPDKDKDYRVVKLDYVGETKNE